MRSYRDLPFLPVRLFKELELKSVSQEDIVKTMTSSGTTGQAVSKIYLDRATSSNQQKTMVKIVSEFTGSNRMPMIIIDCPSVVKNRAMFSARGAGILGFSIFGSKKIYALDDDMRLLDLLEYVLEYLLFLMELLYVCLHLGLRMRTLFKSNLLLMWEKMKYDSEMLLLKNQ